MKTARIALLGFILTCAIPSYAVTKTGTLSNSENWSLTDSPVVIEGALNIPQGIKVVVEPGVQVQLKSGASIAIRGEFNAQGSASAPIAFKPDGNNRWGYISYELTGNGNLSHCTFTRGSNGSGSRWGMLNAYQCAGAVVIDSCTFTDWPTGLGYKAVGASQSQDVSVRRSWFGKGANEGIYTEGTPILVEYNTFDLRQGYTDSVDVGLIKPPKPRPIIRYNLFLGGEDDSIDLDDCDAWVEGNWVMNFRGGDNDPIGISGDRTSQPIIVNNVVINCESGIAFKNGAQITVINNTIIDCDKGIWMHQNPAHAKVVNTIIWGKENQVSVKLEPGSTIDVSYSILRGAEVYPGIGNSNADPRFVDPVDNNYDLLDPAGNNYAILPNSPAIDAGLGYDLVPTLDYFLKPRMDIVGIDNKGQGTPAFVDLGAIEFQPEVSRILDWLMQRN